MFTNDWEPINLLAIDNHWKRAKNGKFVFGRYGHKKPKDKTFSEFLGTVIISFFSEEMFSFLRLQHMYINFFVKVANNDPKLHVLNTLGGVVSWS